MNQEEKLINDNMGLVFTIVEKFKPRNEEEQEALIQAGMIGLWKSTKKYDISKNVKFCTYAWRSIYWHVLKELKFIHKSSPCQTHNEAVYPQSEIWEFFPDNLEQSEIDIINMRFEGHTFKSIGQKVNKNRTHIRKRFDEAMEKIRESYEKGINSQ